MQLRVPKISVVIPLYNHEKYVKEAIQSVLQQSFSDLELIVINDGSTDRSEEVVKGIRDHRMTYFSQDNQGAPQTINRGIRLAKGEYIAVLNSDDVYHVDRLQEAVRVLEADHSLSAVFSHVECIDESGKITGVVRGLEENWKRRDGDATFEGTTDLALGLLAGNCLLTTSNLVCRRTVFDEIGYFREFRYGHDYDFFLRLCSRMNGTILNTPLVRYRIHGGNTVKESEADVSCEIGLILADFLLQNPRDAVFGHDRDWSDSVLKLFNSIDTRNTDRLMMVLLLSGLVTKDGTKTLLEELIKHPEHPLRKRCVEAVQYQIDLWRSSQELGVVLAERDRLRADRDRLQGDRDRLQASVSYRVGLAVTWPARKLLGSLRRKPASRTGNEPLAEGATVSDNNGREEVRRAPSEPEHRQAWRIEKEGFASTIRASDIYRCGTEITRGYVDSQMDRLYRVIHNMEMTGIAFKGPTLDVASGWGILFPAIRKYFERMLPYHVAEMANVDGIVIDGVKIEGRIFECERDVLPYDDSTFGVVMFCDCLEHLIVDPMWTLLEFNRVLQVGGHLIISTPNIAALHRVYAILQGETPATESAIKPCAIYQRHNREWTPREITDALHRCGFQNVRYSTNAEMLSEGDRNFVHACKTMGISTRRFDEYGPEIFVSAEKVQHRTLSSPLGKDDRWPEWLYSSHEEYRRRPKRFPIVVGDDYA